MVEKNFASNYDEQKYTFSPKEYIQYLFNQTDENHMLCLSAWTDGDEYNENDNIFFSYELAWTKDDLKELEEEFDTLYKGLQVLSKYQELAAFYKIINYVPYDVEDKRDFSYNFMARVARVSQLLAIGAPKSSIIFEANTLIETMVVYKYCTHCTKIIGVTNQPT